MYPAPGRNEVRARSPRIPAVARTREDTGIRIEIEIARASEISSLLALSSVVLMASIRAEITLVDKLALRAYRRRRYIAQSAAGGFQVARRHTAIRGEIFLRGKERPERPAISVYFFLLIVVLNFQFLKTDKNGGGEFCQRSHPETNK